jgi:hypothetical protein
MPWKTLRKASAPDKLAREQTQEQVLRAWAQAYALPDPDAFVRKHSGLPLAPDAAQWLARAESLDAQWRNSR